MKIPNSTVQRYDLLFDTECIPMTARVGKSDSIFVESISKILFLLLPINIEGMVQRFGLFSNTECVFMTAHIGKGRSIAEESSNNRPFLLLRINIEGMEQRY